MAYWVNKPRPKKPQRRCVPVTFKLSQDEKSMLKSHMKQRSTTLGEYIRLAVFEQVKRDRGKETRF